MTNLFFSCVAADIAKDAKTQAQSEKYVLRIALCWGSPGAAAAELKLGQNIHKNTVPTRENMSDVRPVAWKVNVKEFSLSILKRLKKLYHKKLMSFESN